VVMLPLDRDSLVEGESLLRAAGRRDRRQFLYCGEWIESHVLHIFMLHAPDFLGYPDAIGMAQDHPEMVISASWSVIAWVSSIVTASSI
jgi:coenzyme F420-reducing hydrogenase alpha subunit